MDAGAFRARAAAPRSWRCQKASTMTTPSTLIIADGIHVSAPPMVWSVEALMGQGRPQTS